MLGTRVRRQTQHNFAMFWKGPTQPQNRIAGKSVGMPLPCLFWNVPRPSAGIVTLHIGRVTSSAPKTTHPNSNSRRRKKSSESACFLCTLSGRMGENRASALQGASLREMTEPSKFAMPIRECPSPRHQNRSPKYPSAVQAKLTAWAARVHKATHRYRKRRPTGT